MNIYLIWVQKTKSTGLNLSSLISKEVSRSAGKKGGTSRRKGAPKGKKKAEIDSIGYNPPTSPLTDEEP